MNGGGLSGSRWGLRGSESRGGGLNAIFPLEGGFRANVTGNYEIFDQWLEILPTDQVAPVEVKYNPKTGRQV